MVDDKEQAGSDKIGQEHEIRYFVNGETETTADREMTVRKILSNAEFTPVEDYELSSENPPVDYEDRYDEVVRVHENQRFLAKFKGPTSTSQN